MKKLTLLKTLLVLIGVLITSVTTQVWADCTIEGMSTVKLAMYENGAWNERNFTDAGGGHFTYNAFLPANTSYDCQWYISGTSWTDVWYVWDGNNDNPYTARSGEDGTVARTCFSGSSSKHGTSNSFTTATASSGYTHLYVDYWGKYYKDWNGVGIKFWYAPVEALGLTSIVPSSETVASNGTITMSGNEPTGGSGTYSYSYTASIGSFDGNTYTAPWVFNPTEVTITGTMTDAESSLSGLGSVQRTTTVTVNRPTSMWIKTQFYDWDNWGWGDAATSNGDGTYSKVGKYKANTGLNWDVANRGDTDGKYLQYIAPGDISIIKAENDNLAEGEFCSIKLAPTSWSDASKAATASIIKRYTVTVEKTTIGTGDGGSDAPSILGTSYSSDMADYGASLTFTAADEEDGYTFIGWFTNNEGTGNAYKTSKSFTETIDGAKAYYAIYRENTYAIGVSAAGEHGRITTPASPATSVTAGAYTNPTITAEVSGDNSGHYRFWKWTCTGGASVADATSATTTVSATGTGAVTANFVSVWCIKGGAGPQDGVDDEMGDWNVCNSLDYTGTSYMYEGQIYLLGGTTYQFKVMDYPSNAYYGYGTADNYDMAFVGQTGAQKIYNNSGSDHNIRLMTAGTGWYTFNWNSESEKHLLTVTFPDVETHPSINYVYFDDDANWNGTQGGVSVHLTGGTTTGSNSMPYAGSCTISGKTYYYSALGDNTSVRFSGSNNVSDYTTGNVSASSNMGKYYDQGTSTWQSFTFSISYKDEGGGVFSGSQTSAPTTHTFGAATTLKIPTKSGYTFGGWFTSSDCTTGAVGNTSSASLGATDYTANITLYAKWTENMTSVTLTASPSGKGSFTIGGEAATSTTAGVTTTRSVTAVATTGYHVNTSATVWARNNENITLSSTTTNPVTITGCGTDGTSSTLTATFTPNSYSVRFNANGGSGSMSNQAFTYGDAQNLTANAFYKIGYAFAGWATAADEAVAYSNGQSVSNLTSTDGATVDLYAVWEEDNKTFKEGETSSWTNSGSWTGGVPSNDYSNVTINGEVTLSTSVHIGELSFGASGKLIIAATGTLAVEGTITNTDASKIEINTTSSSQGALIYDIGTKPYATVKMTTANAGSGFQYIASPIGAVSVSDVFDGKGVYTYAWIEGKGWDHRGYYEDFSGDEVILLKGKTSCTFSGQLNPTTSHSITYMAEEEDGFNENAQGVNMVPNTLTAPIRIASMNLYNAYEGAVHIWNGSTWDKYAKNSCGEAVIPALQGYAVLTETGGTVSFTYDAAVRGASSHNDALKAPQRTNSDIQDHITVSVTTNERKENLLLYENNQFSDAIDKGWEALYMEGDGTYGELYAHAKEPMSILATDDLEGTVVGFVPGKAENYTISFEGDGKGYYLNDVKEEEATLIEEGNTYEFAADAATNATRFVISKTPIAKTPTSVENINDGVKARKQLIDGALYIIRDGRMYNAEGAVVK